MDLAVDREIEDCVLSGAGFAGCPHEKMALVIIAQRITGETIAWTRRLFRCSMINPVATPWGMLAARWISVSADMSRRSRTILQAYRNLTSQWSLYREMRQFR
jgi:hypothetical protein